MVKAAKHSNVAEELKKEYLRDHLESIKGLIRNWMVELHPPEPLAPNDRIWGWQSRYRSPRLDNTDDNHMLRHHLKSRALWTHHSNWEKKLEEIWYLTEQVRSKAKAQKMKQAVNSQWKYTEDYVPVALWKAFDLATGGATDLPFKVPDDRLGISYGAYKIEESANSPETRMLIEEQYKAFIRSISRTSMMKKLANAWLEASQLESQTSMISEKMLKSGDIFYVCRFCKHLWT